MKVLHVLDHSIPLHSGYSFRTRAILTEQRALGIETFHVTSTKNNQPYVPEVEVDFDRMCTLLTDRRKNGKPYGIIIVSEGAETIEELVAWEKDQNRAVEIDAETAVSLEDQGEIDAAAPPVDRDEPQK